MVDDRINNENVYYFGYSRKSPDDKLGTETSINNQNDLHIHTCKLNSWNLVSIEEDKDISGGDTNRRGLSVQIKKSIEFKKDNPDADVRIGVKDSKRFARNSSFAKETLQNLEVNGVKVFSIMKHGFLDYSDIGDRIIGVVDEQAIYDGKNYAKISEELKISKNLPCIPAPFGYKYNKEKNWSIVKKDGKIVLAVVSDYLNKRSYKATIKDNKILKTKYYRILKNFKKGVYSGIITYNKKIKDSAGIVVRIDEIKYKGSYDPIISEELWEKVNQ